VRSLLVVVLVLSLAILASAQRATDPPAFQAPIPPAVASGYDEVVKPFLAENCYPCHGDKKQEKELNFQAFTSAASLQAHRERWEEVARKLRASEMPPIEEDQPPEEQRQAVAAWLETELERIDRVTPPDPGRITARRLNRTEYNNTVRDLLGVDDRPADDFPQDDTGYGFDNIADVLSLSPVLMEQYVKTADRMARLAVYGPPQMEPTLTRLRSEGRRNGSAREFPARYDVTGLSLPNSFHATFRVPVTGEYMIRATLGGVRPAGSEPITIALWIDDQEVQSQPFDLEGAARFDLDRQDFGGQAREFRVRLEAGDRHVAVAIPHIFEGLPPRLGGPNPSSRPEPIREFTPRPGQTPEQVARAKTQFEQTQAELAKIPYDGVRVGSVEVGGPYTQVSGPADTSVRQVLVCGHTDGKHGKTCMARIVSDVARRAFRRPVTTRELKPYVELAELAQRQEGSFDEGLVVGLQALLVSPDFLFRIEHDRAGNGPQAVSQHELATRLSYFLWASMPDAELRRAADAGTLRKREVLEAQVRRMLQDPKARSIASQFGGQWLQFRGLESIVRDRDRYPEFDDYLRLSMRRETELFVDAVVREDRSILDFLNGRYTYLNERLARHYGLDGISGPAFRRVELTDPRRGGVLTQASVLTVSSYATRTSPVMRGKWVLENLLDAPPPPPPADVPNLDEAAIGASASMREQLEIHRANPTCASCHRRMDPLGFGLENFDAVGAWREIDGKFPIDASGQLPDGRTFTGPEELRAILSGNEDAFARCVTSKLLTYALGRGLEQYDTRTVKAIAAQLPAQGYRFSALVLDIVNSLPFQSRRGAQNP
jgi:mono/diheme cytochrome c family protein